MALEFVSLNSQYVDCGNQGPFVTICFWVIPGVRADWDFWIGHTRFRFCSVDITGHLGLGDAAAGWVDTVYDMDLHVGELLHLVGISNGVNSKIYVNAIDETTASANMQAVVNSAFNIGRWTGDAHYVDGTTFDVRIYNRILSQAEITTIYNARGADNIVNDLIARWLMNEAPDGTVAAGANSVIDVSVSGSHVTPNNSPVYRAAPIRLVRPAVSTKIKTL